MRGNDARAGFDVVGIGESARYAGCCLDEDLMPALEEQFRADRHHRDTVFIRFNFLGNSDTHKRNLPEEQTVGAN